MARKSQESPPQIESRRLTRDEIDRAIAKLRRRIVEIEGLDPSVVSYGDAKVEMVQSNVRESILEIFGSNSSEFEEYGHFVIWHGGYNTTDSELTRQRKFADGRPQAVVRLEGLIARLEERREDALPGAGPPSTTPPPVTGSRRVFVVHGRDDAAKEAVARFLEHLKLRPIILHEEANQGRTIIEKFEDEAKVDFAVVLLTPDDLGSSANTPDDRQKRARQNVIFELGYFIGRLGRSRVCALYKPGVELPSDFDGVLYVSMDDPQGWRLLLAREIKAAGVAVDLNLAM